MHLAGHQPTDGGDGDTRRNAAFQPGDSDHVELVEVGREDGQEFCAFQQRHPVGIVGQIENSFVEGEPGQLAVQKSIRRQLHMARRREQVLHHGRDLDCFHISFS